MKHCTQLVLAALCLLASVTATAQKSLTRPSLFSNYPDVINCTEAQLASLFSFQNDVEVTLLLPNGLELKGPVKWWAKKYANLQTVTLKLTEFNNTLFSVTRHYDAADHFVYVGHLFNPAFADGYELKHTGDKHYQLVKMETEKLLQICSR